MDDYRINTRFNLKIEAERNAAEYLRALGRKWNSFYFESGSVSDK